MSGKRSLSAEWAVMGKVAGDRRDDRVLDSSQDHRVFEELIRGASPGTPENRSGDGPGALPWVTFDAYGGEGEAFRSAVAVKTWSPDVDGSGRPIARTAYFTFPYVKGAQVAVGYRGLYDAVVTMKRPATDEPVTLEVRALDPHAFAERIDAAAGFVWYASVAALAVNGPVALTGGGSFTLRERVEHLDAVTALLPYGVRASLRAATWVDPLADHAARLFFCDRPGPRDQRAVRWGVVPEVPEGTAGHAYLTALLGARERGTLWLVERLASTRRPLELDGGVLLDAVNELRLTDAPVSVEPPAPHRGTADEQRAAVAHEEFDGLPDERRESLVRPLVIRSAVEDVKLVTNRWPRVSGHVARTARTELVAGRSRPARVYLAVADRDGQAGAFVGELLGTERFTTREETLRTAEFLHRCGPPGEAQWVEARTALIRHPQVVHRLLYRQIQDEDASGLRGWLRWMAGQEAYGPPLPGWLRPFAGVVLGLADWKLGIDELTAEFGAGGVVTLLETAVLTHRVDVALPGVWLPLVRLAVGDRTGEAFSRARHALARARSTDPVYWPALDLLLMLHDLPPVWAPAASGSRLAAYAAGLEQVWPTLELDKSREAIARSLAEAVATRRGPAQRLAMVDPLIGRAVAERLGPGGRLSLVWFAVRTCGSRGRPPSERR